MIYCLVNTVTGKVYIGKSERPGETRAREHFKFALRGETGCPHLYSAIRKYGPETFQICVVSDFAASREELNMQERYYIEKYRANDPEFGYNLTAGGDGLSNPSPETRRKMRLAQLGKTHSLETRRKMRLAQLGNKHNLGRVQPPEEREARSKTNPRKGVPCSEAQRQHLSRVNRGRGGSLSALGKRRVYNPHSGEARFVPTEEVETWTEAGWSLGLSVGHTANLAKAKTGVLPSCQEQGAASVRGTRWVHNPQTGESQRVPKEKLPGYLDQGWACGRKASV